MLFNQSLFFTSHVCTHLEDMEYVICFICYTVYFFLPFEHIQIFNKFSTVYPHRYSSLTEIQIRDQTREPCLRIRVQTREPCLRIRDQTREPCLRIRVQTREPCLRIPDSRVRSTGSYPRGKPDPQDTKPKKPDPDPLKYNYNPQFLSLSKFIEQMLVDKIL